MYRRGVVASLATLSLAGCLRLSEGASEETTAPGGDSGGDSSQTSATSQSSGGDDVDIWVAAEGENGDGSEAAPFTDVRQALGEAEPGDTVYFRSGEYRLNGVTRASGEPGNPIEVTGPEDAVLRAREGEAPVFGIIHSHVHVTGCTFDGLADEDRQWQDPSAWSRTMVRISPGPRYDSEGVDYLEDVVFEPHAVRNAGSTFVHVERSRDVSVGDFEVTGPAGAGYHPDMENPVDSHIGHVFQVGSSPPTIEEYKPWDGLDRTRNVRFHHVDNSAGYHHSSFIDVRVGSEAVTVEYCTDRNSGNATTDQEYVPAVDVGGNNCTVRGNDFGDCRQGVVFGAWTPTDMAAAENWARNNDVYSNRFQGVERAVFRFLESSADAQRTLCDNRLVGVDDAEYEYATGACGDEVSEVDGIGYNAGE